MMLVKYLLLSVVVRTRMNEDYVERIRGHRGALQRSIQPGHGLLTELRQFPALFLDLALRDIWVNVLLVAACVLLVCLVLTDSA
jgi:hypothetical protein